MAIEREEDGIEFVQPRDLDANYALSLTGKRVLVCGVNPPVDVDEFERTVGSFITALGTRLVAWVNNPGASIAVEWLPDPRFRLFPDENAQSCFELVTESLYEEIGPVDVIVVTADICGVYVAARWIMEGLGLYGAAANDLTKLLGQYTEMSPIGAWLRKIIEAHPNDLGLMRDAVEWLVSIRVRPEVEARLSEAYERAQDREHGV